MEIMAVTQYQDIGCAQPDGLRIGNVATDKVAFYGSTPIVQRSGASQGTYTTTTVQSSGWGFATSTAADAASALLTEIRAALVAYGLMKGSA